MTVTPTGGVTYALFFPFVSRRVWEVSGPHSDINVHDKKKTNYNSVLLRHEKRGARRSCRGGFEDFSLDEMKNTNWKQSEFSRLK